MVMSQVWLVPLSHVDILMDSVANCIWNAGTRGMAYYQFMLTPVDGTRGYVWKACGGLVTRGKYCDVSWVELIPTIACSPGAKMGTWKCLRVQGFMIDPESIGVLKEIKLGCHDSNLGELFYFHNS